MHVSVILPTYNERGNIVPLIQNILLLFSKTKITGEAIVVDDNSSDGTALICRKTFGRRSNVHVFVRKKERGLATAIWAGTQKAKGDYLVVMDTDLSHDPSVIPLMRLLTKNKTMVIGSRYIAGGGMENKKRYWLSRIFNVYLRFLFRLPVTDFLSGFFCAKRLVILELGKTYPDIFTGYGDYFMRLIAVVAKRGGTFVEVPVYYRNRPYGVSKSKFLMMFLSYTKASLQLRREQ